ncbi:c-type cytochrome [Chryseobacterium sp. Leaf394]|uniref:c-type cytochrome n=1 Tax=Chryseobacterium sp. Leaf394 TaxID=1736361 RepID=UPI0006FFDF22|nr:c-type cytochrome [Chryseobacterium sp. Leaf394]KQS92151.1 cytochrome C [Chryseobacterium sp. Leaf394]
MKKLFLAGMAGFFVISCSKKETSEPQSTESKDVATSVVSNSSGQTMIETSDCLSCHSINERMIGPSYKEIAEKYSEKDIELLASKIIEGGSGVWGSVPMQPHPQFSKEDAKKMVEYILKQKK